MGSANILQIGSFCMGLCYAAMTISIIFGDLKILFFVALLAYIVFFELSIGPIMWVYCADILPDKAVAITSATNFVFFGLVYSVSTLKMSSDVYIIGLYCFYIVMCAVLFLVSRYYFGVNKRDSKVEELVE